MPEQEEKDSIYKIVQRYNTKQQFGDAFGLVNALYLHVREGCRKCHERCREVMHNED